MEPQPSTSAQQPSTSSDDQQPRFNFRAFCARLVPIVPFNFGQLLAAGTTGAGDWQVAGHSGFLSGDNLDCYKPINPKCARGRREHLFYQLVAHYKRHPRTTEPLFYKHFKVLLHPDKICDCRIDPETFKTVSQFMAQFKHVKHLVLEGDDYEENRIKQNDYSNQMYSQDPWCPCYSDDKKVKNACFLNFDQEDYICMEDLNAHCHEACILDIKMGRITYDPMASKLKKEDQVNKYPRLRDFGFRILGMRTPLANKDKAFGRSLETQEQIFAALESFFEPLQTSDHKAVVIGRMLDRLEALLEWFETKNENQVRFYSSSLLFIYDVSLVALKDPKEVITAKLKRSVRVSMIDFAHVFHSHDPPVGTSRTGSSSSSRTSDSTLNKDDNYLYGLRRLVKFFIMMNRQHRIRVQQELDKQPFNWRA